jgi:hypothetical protein
VLAERIRDDVAVAREALDRVVREPAAVLGEPARVREVVERDEGGQPVLGQTLEHVPVVVERGLVEHARRRLDA